MRVKNLKCETCQNSSMCSGFKALSKFSEDYVRNPLIPDITMDDCVIYVEKEDIEDDE